MASPSRRSDRHLTEELKSHGPEFGFFQAVRLLALGKGGRKRPPLPEKVRFESLLTLAFPASEIHALREVRPNDESDAAAGDPEIKVSVGFMGMTGASGVLPTAYTELLLERRNHHRDTTAHDFLNLFSHRAISLFYKAWRKHRFYLPFESGEDDRFSRNLLDLVGVGLTNLRDRLDQQGCGIPDRFLIHYAGLLSQKPVSAANIAAIVRGYFNVDAVLEQYVGQWMLVPQEEQSQLGRGACALGESAFLGERLWDRLTKVRIRLGPLTRAQFDELLPGNRSQTALRELIQFCVGHTLSCDAQLVLRKEDIPPPKLEASQLRLGHNVWLNTGRPEQDAADVQFALLAA
jgi:type VI secretion system protein ImpH